MDPPLRTHTMRPRQVNEKEKSEEGRRMFTRAEQGVIGASASAASWQRFVTLFARLRGGSMSVLHAEIKI